MSNGQTSSQSGQIYIDPDDILRVRKNGDLAQDMGGGEIRNYNPTTSTYVLRKPWKTVFYSIITERACVYLKKEKMLLILTELV